jgi:hypothetical protein
MISDDLQIRPMNILIDDDKVKPRSNAMDDLVRRIVDREDEVIGCYVEDLGDVGNIRGCG